MNRTLPFSPAPGNQQGNDPRAKRLLFWFVTVPVLVLVILCGGWPSGCSREDPAQRVYVALSPLAVVLPRDKILAAAEYYASLRPNALVMRGDDVGMMPLYLPGTLLVVEPIPYATLKEGMTAVFRRADGLRVAHYLVRLQADGWTTRGLNVQKPDVDPMTAANYLGVIVMAFAPAGTPRAG